MFVLCCINGGRRGIINWMFPLKLLLLKSWFCEGIYLQQALQVISWISYPRGSVQQWPGSQELWFRVLLAWVMCELLMTWCTHELWTALTPMEWNSRCAAEQTLHREIPALLLRGWRWWTAVAASRCLQEWGWHWLGCSGELPLGKAIGRGGVWGAAAGTTGVVLVTLSSFPGRLCPHVLSLLLLLCALREHCPDTCRAPNAQEYSSFLLKVTGYLLFQFHPEWIILLQRNLKGGRERTCCFQTRVKSFLSVLELVINLSKQRL